MTIADMLQLRRLTLASLLVSSVAMCLSCSNGNPAPRSKDELREVVHNLAQQLADAIVAGDMAKAAQFMPSDLIAAAGGTDQIQRELSNNTSAPRITSVHVHQVLLLATDADIGVAVVPTTTRSTAREIIVVTESYLIAYSEDSQQTWKFIEGSSVVADYVRQRYPTLAPNLLFPQRRKTLSDPESVTVMELVEVDGEWRPTKATLERFKTLLDRANRPASPPAIDSPTYVNETYGFSVRFPEHWNIEEGVVPPVITKASNVHEDEHIAQITIEVMEDYLPAGTQWPVGGEVLFDLMQKRYRQNNVAYLGSGNTQINGLDCLWIAMRLDAAPALISKTWWFRYKGRLFRLAGSVMGDDKQYENNELLFERTAHSFHIHR